MGSPLGRESLFGTEYPSLGFNMHLRMWRLVENAEQTKVIGIAVIDWMAQAFTKFIPGDVCSLNDLVYIK